MYPINKPTTTKDACGIIILTKSMEWVRMDKISKIKTDLLMREWAEMVREYRSSRLTVKEWCINNEHHFIRQFKKITGITPGKAAKTH